ncbi:MAG: hypothetical protein JWO97_2005 [Acidobacteria bacterium]|nr:hypothetical protein [Acidobacteriota bacterium]
MMAPLLMRKVYPERSEGSPVRQLCLPLLLALVAFTATTSQPITEIQLRRTACYGVCPDDELTIRTDGTVTYRGMKSERAGDWRGRLSRADAEQLARTIESLGFAKLASEYGERDVDAPDYFVTVTRGRKSKTIVNHMQQVPPVAPIITAILNASAKVKWLPEPSVLEGTLPPNTPYSVTCGSRTYHALSDHKGHYRLPLRNPHACGKVEPFTTSRTRSSPR